MSASTSGVVPQLHYARNPGTPAPQAPRTPSFKASLYLVAGGICIALFLKFALHSVPEVRMQMHMNFKELSEAKSCDCDRYF